MPKVRSVFLSDIHLGTRACQADRLLDFLREYQAEQTYLIGDIIDFWAMSRSIYWTPAQNTVVQKLLRRARHGERVARGHRARGPHAALHRPTAGRARGGQTRRLAAL